MWVLASNKEINLPNSGMSSDQIYEMLDAVDSKSKEDIKNRMNDSYREFIDKSEIENRDVDNHVSPEPDLDSEDNDVPLRNFKAPKDDEEWNCRKQCKEVATEKFKFTKEGIVNTEIENPSPIQKLFFSNTVGLERAILGLLG